MRIWTCSINLEKAVNKPCFNTVNDLYEVYQQNIGNISNLVVDGFLTLPFLGNYANYDVIFPRCSSSVVECLRSLACSCLKDVDVPFTLSAMKVI